MQQIIITVYQNSCHKSGNIEEYQALQAHLSHAQTYLHKPPAVPSSTAVLSFFRKSLHHLFLVNRVEAIHAFNTVLLAVILFN